MWREAVCTVMECGASAAVCECMHVCELMSNVLRYVAMYVAIVL